MTTTDVSLSSSVTAANTVAVQGTYLGSLVSTPTAAASVLAELLKLVTLSSAAAAVSSADAIGISDRNVSSTSTATSTLTVGLFLTADLAAASIAATPLQLQSILSATAVSAVAGNATLPSDGTGAAVWVVNTETQASSRYEQYPFNSFAKIGDTYFGAASDGIYQLDGGTDAGSPVQAMVSFGKQRFGTSQQKRVTNAYIGTSSTGRLFLRVKAGGHDYTYAARSSDEDLQTQRVDTGRGVKAAFFEFELYNSDGDDFELASVEFVAIQLSRRI